MMAIMEHASRTAEHVALFRALETTRRHDRLFTDRYARRFLPARYRWLVRAATLGPVGHGIERLIDRNWPGPRTSAVVRTKLIDDLLTEALGAGAVQVLLLGAGYDARAHRVPGMPTTFEVDHPATQRAKRRLIADPAHVRYVPVDLNTDDLGTALETAGFTRRRTVVIWEGVTNYLTAAAVDATLRHLATATAQGSTVIFTYVDEAARAGEFPGFPGFTAWHDTVTKVGEPWTFGFHPAELPAYLADRGMELTLDLSTRDAATRYHRDGQAAPFYRVASAVVS